MRCLIVDDERPARQEMRALLSQHPEVEVIGEAADVDAALALTNEHHPDIVFLDIKLTGESGFDYVARLGEPQPRIVFVTAFDTFAVRAFECNAMDYLLKPIRPERLAATLSRASAQTLAPAKAGDPVFLKGPSTARFAAWTDIQHIQSEGNYTSVRFRDGTVTLVLRPLKAWRSLAPAGRFLQVHRAVLVQRSAIRELRFVPPHARELVLTDGTSVPVGRAYWPEVKLALGME